MAKLWQKQDSKPLHPLVEKYTVGSDYVLDKELIKYDIQASKAHAKMLGKIEILDQDEVEKIVSTLEELEQKDIEITIQDEDCHTVIENYLVEKLGDIGKKIHTGRSRNDQVLVAIRLYMKDNLEKTKEQTKKLAQTFLKLAKKHQQTPFPGYSHTQQAMPTSLGHYYASFVESLLDDIEFLEKTKEQVDKNPLGSAAGFGVSFPLDREYTTKELGFEKTQINSLYCQNSRGKFESIYLEALTQIMLTLNKFSTDMILFTTQEFNFFTVDESLTTGSSIMPQKKNLDLLEILRGNTSVVSNNKQMVLDISKNLMSGYNRDLQLIKKPLIESTNIVQDSIEIVDLFVQNIEPNMEEIKQKTTPEIYTADIANELVEEGTPFREAYQKAKEKLGKTEIDEIKGIDNKKSPGGPGNLYLENYKKRLN